jgi:UDP-2,3-diacylglucosamine pyrophosphatase LpxH
MLDAVILSDLHLGSDNCQARALVEFLEQIDDGRRATARLILNGDVFDSIDFRRLKKHHWRVLSLLRKLSDRMEIVWICGNHDGPAEVVSHLLGVATEEEYVFPSGGRRLLVLHGHVFDEFIDNHPILTFLADTVYRLLQRVDKSHAFAKWAKRGSKTFLRCAGAVQVKAVEYAGRRGCDAVCCGHTHAAREVRGGTVHYFNSGCWTERPCTYLTVADGEVRLHEFDAGTPAVSAGAGPEGGGHAEYSQAPAGDRHLAPAGQRGGPDA